MTLGSWCDKGLKVGEWVCGWMGWWGYGGSGGMGMFVRESVGVEATLALKVISFFAGKTPNLSCKLRYSLSLVPWTSPPLLLLLLFTLPL